MQMQTIMEKSVNYYWTGKKNGKKIVPSSRTQSYQILSAASLSLNKNDYWENVNVFD